MESIVFFGKGGIGKSTIAANVSAVLAARGLKVLHIGCDPKMDSTLSLTGRRIPPFCTVHGEGRGTGLSAGLFQARVKGVTCVEAGGPQPGVGCAGAAIGSLLDAMRDEGVLAGGNYDAAVFDVLGDVVCGGFAAPLRRGFARKAVIVTSEELLSLYAANNLLKMLNNYSRNGVYLAGLVLNCKDAAGVATAERFAAAVRARVLGVTLRDPVVGKAEKKRVPAALAFPGSDFAARAVRLCAAITAAKPPAAPPEPMSDEAFSAFCGGAPVAAPGLRPGSARPAAPEAQLKAAGFEVEELRGGRLFCSWNSSRGPLGVIFMPRAEAAEGMICSGDWGVCVAPSHRGGQPRGSAEELAAAAGRLAGVRYRDLLAAFSGPSGLYEGLAGLSGPGDKTLAAPHNPAWPDAGLGQWQRFIFPAGFSACAAPGAAMLDHGDMECRFSGGAGGVLGFFDFPGSEVSPGLPITAPRSASTDFSLKDAISGSEDSLLRRLGAVAASAGPGGLVDLGIGCSPILLAPDLPELAAKAAAEAGVDIAVEEHNSFRDGGRERALKHAAYMSGRLRVGRKSGGPDVCLLGFGRRAGPLVEMLAERGVRASAPGPDFYPEAASARLRVLAARDNVMSQAFGDAGLAWSAPPAPYGFRATTAWLGDIGRALGKKLKGPSGAQVREAAALRRAASAFMTGFILDESELALLLGGSGGAALALASADEAGFRIMLLLRTSGPGRGVRAGRARVGFSSRRFSTRGELYGLLASLPRLRAVYSDIRGDSRLQDSGKAPFSSALLEPGYEGALETARRLIELSGGGMNEFR